MKTEFSQLVINTQKKIFWPDERSTWTNAAYIIAKDCLYDVTKKRRPY